MLDKLYTAYAYKKNTIARKFVKRVDREEIPESKFKTNLALAFPIKFFSSKVHIWNDLFDRWVALDLRGKSSNCFIGWSGMSLHSIRVAKSKGMLTILERGSSHIVYQNEILKDEYTRNGLTFQIHPAVIEKELKEYESADYISIPSQFVKDSFISKGISANKLIVNNYGSGSFFNSSLSDRSRNRPFTILYLGHLSYRKGLIYLFEALNQLGIPESQYRVWFIGSILPEVSKIIEHYKRTNWTFWGHVNHYDLEKYLHQCDIGIQPSIEEGLSMVIPQMMRCGIPVIATVNSGGGEIIQSGINGYIVKIRNANEIKDKIEFLHSNRHMLQIMKDEAIKSILNGFTWQDYGNRYVENIKKII